MWLVTTVSEAQETLTSVTAGATSTVTVLLPCFEESPTAVAVTVTVPAFVGAVSNPVEEIVPALVDQYTALLKAPVPITVELHWSV